MIVPDDFLKAFAAPSLDDLNQRIIREREELQGQLWTAGGRPILALTVLCMIDFGLVLFTDPRSDWGRVLMMVVFGAIFFCIRLKKTREDPVIAEIERFERRVEKRVAVMPIRLGTLPHTTFVAVLTPSGGFDLFPVGVDGIEASLQAKFGDTCVVAPPFRLDALAACRVPLNEFEMVIDALACGIGEQFIVPTCVERDQIVRLAQYEASVISSN